MNLTASYTSGPSLLLTGRLRTARKSVVEIIQKNACALHQFELFSVMYI